MINIRNNEMSKTSKTLKLHPQAQVIITGKPLQPEEVAKLNDFIKDSFCVKNWFNPEGSIGHLDSIEPGTTMEKFRNDWNYLRDCLFLDLGITLMNGPPGSFVTPIVSYKLKHGVLQEGLDVHFLHPPPRRFKPKKPTT